MTASPEETAEAARKAMHSTAKEITYTAIDGRLAAREVETVVAQFASPAQWSVANRSELVQRARLALSAATPRPPESGARRTGLRPFLHALTDALREPGPAQAEFVYGARQCCPRNGSSASRRRRQRVKVPALDRRSSGTAAALTDRVPGQILPSIDLRGGGLRQSSRTTSQRRERGRPAPSEPRLCRWLPR
jgi:hypothetical protein